MEKTVYQQSVCYLAQSCASKFSRQLDLLLQPYGLTAAQYKVVDQLTHRGEMTAAELSKACNMNTGAMTRLLDRLEDKAFIQRGHDSSDGRVRTLSMTVKGSETVAAVAGVIAPFNESEGLFSQQELKQLNHLLTRLDKGLDLLPPLES